MWKKMNTFGYFTMLGILLVLFLVMLQHGIKSQCLLDDMKEHRFSVIFTLITVQNDLHPFVCTILCFWNEQLLPVS
jgi:hypothetical protein